MRTRVGSEWHRLQRRRPWRALAGFVLIAGVLVPPGGAAARHYVFAQAVQFGALAVAAPALVVLGAPWRLAAALAPAGWRNLGGQVVSARSHQTRHGPVWLPLVAFIAVADAWRLPVAVDALVRYPAPAVAEAVTLLATGCALWIELVESIAVSLLWAIPGLCFAPVIYASLIRWLRDSADPDGELRGIPDAHAGTTLPRPPRGWGLPSR